MKNLHDASTEAAADSLEEIVQGRLKIAREIGFDRGISVVCSLLQQLGHHDLAIEYVKNLMATALGEKLASMTYEQREPIVKALNPRKGSERHD